MRSVQRLPILTPVARQGAPNAIAVPLTFHKTETLPGSSHALGWDRPLIRYVSRSGAKQTATDASRVGGRLWDPQGTGKMTRRERLFSTHSWWAVVRGQPQRSDKGYKRLWTRIESKAAAERSI